MKSLLRIKGGVYVKVSRAEPLKKAIPNIAEYDTSSRAWLLGHSHEESNAARFGCLMRGFFIDGPVL